MKQTATHKKQKKAEAYQDELDENSKQNHDKNSQQRRALMATATAARNTSVNNEVLENVNDPESS